MKALLQKFFDYLRYEKQVADNTYQAYQRDIMQFEKYLMTYTAVQDFAQLTVQHTKDFLRFLKLQSGVTSKSSSRKLSALKTLSLYLHRYHDIPLFTQGVAFPKLSKQLPKNITQEQIKKLLEKAAEDVTPLGHRNKIMIYLLYVCGMRVSELVNLKVSEISFEENYIKIFGKGGKQRIIPLPAEMNQALLTYTQHTHRYLLTSSLSSGKQIERYSDYLFPIYYSGKIQPITRQAFWRILKEIAQKAGFVHTVSPHMLRHSLATHMLKRGANLRVLQTLLGHEKINTVQIYTHLDMSHLRDLYDKYHPRA
ncbi:tyrosine-type recombinase/integrase [Candidatus Dependentiae bacterium]|nr:tyrosine-type recombinase/integrase [Candidatus Dependentiae bacterium]